MSNSNDKLHLPVVRVLPLQKTSSIAPLKLLLDQDKYYKNKENNREQEYYILTGLYLLG